MGGDKFPGIDTVGECLSCASQNENCVLLFQYIHMPQ